MAPRQILAGTLLLLASAAPVGAQGAPPLTPDEVLRSVALSLPLLERARQDVALAQGEALETRGAFDLKIKSEALAIRGFYDSDRVKTVLEQPLSTWGLTPYGSYRTGTGTFAPYDTKAQTLSDGELTGGFALPLLRDRSIDLRRADRQSADLGVGVAERALDKARLTYFKEALSEYWDWAAAGLQRTVAQALLDLAEARDQQLADAAALGQVAPVERTDNRRAILQRRSAVAISQRVLEQQAIDVLALSP